MTNNDKLQMKIQSIQKEVNELRNSMYREKFECACKGDRLCGYHAEISGYLQDMSDKADSAVYFLENETHPLFE